MAQTFLITANTGIGAETARQLALRDKETQILFTALDEEKCASLVAELNDLGAVSTYFVGDLTDTDTAPKVVAACIARFGRIDGLFNVAGISGRRYGDGPAHECTEDGWSRTMETNVTTLYRMCRETLKAMRQQAPGPDGQRGVILNMASILAVSPEPDHFDTVAYAASKGAILAMTRTMAASYMRDKIRVNAIAPALVRTPMSARASEDLEILKFIKQKQPLIADMIPMEDVASACVYLLTSQSRSITGQVLAVDAGWSLASLKTC